MKSNLLSIVQAGILIVASIQTANAISYTISLHELTGTVTDGNNFFDDYTQIGVGRFDIADTAVSPGNLVLFNDPNFLSFNLSMTNSLGDSSTFTLGVDDFYDGVTARPRANGILFDALGNPLRFEYPDFVVADTATMCDPLCEIALGARATLRLQDNNNFESVYLANGDITSRTVIQNTMPPGTPFTPLHGTWAYAKGTSVGGSGSGISGVYTLSAVPIPAAVWLFGSGLLALIGIAGRKRN